MNGINFRALRADEIDVRVNTISQKGCSLLLYKDARCDMNILDETVGSTNWQRRHSRDNANCTVSIWDGEKNAWIEKEDTGTKSYSEEEKGLASDSFKRACFNWGIGRELYTAPFIWIKAENVNIEYRNNKPTTRDRFKVKEIETSDKVIKKLVIENTGQYGDKTDVVYTYPKTQNQPKEPTQTRNETKPETRPAEGAEQEVYATDEDIGRLRDALSEYNRVAGKRCSLQSILNRYKCSADKFKKTDYNKALAEIVRAMEYERQKFGE